MRAKLVALTALIVSFAAAAAPTASAQLGFAGGDDWEPALAVDGSNVYAFWMHFGSPLANCSGTASGAYMAFSRSLDGGATWSAPSSIACQPNNGADAQLKVEPASHRLYASWMNGPQNQSAIYVAFSDDSGATWSAPKLATPGASNGQGGDKDILQVRGREVWVAYEHLTTSYIAYSPDVATRPFVQAVVPAPNGLVSLSTGTALDTRGNVYFAFGGQSQSGQAKGPSKLFVARSSGAGWTVSVVDTSQAQPQVTGAGWDFFGSQMSIAVIPRPGLASDRLVAVYNKGLVAGGAERIYTQYSDDAGATWHGLQELSSAPAGAFHGFAAAAADASGVRVLWMDNGAHPVCTSGGKAGGCGTWNVWYRTSRDGTSAWTAESRVDTEAPTHSFQSAAGFDFPYGDYPSLVLDAAGNAYAAWGEGPDYAGPGNVYFAR
jgi:hypothetical protein